MSKKMSKKKVEDFVQADTKEGCGCKWKNNKVESHSKKQLKNFQKKGQR